MYREGINALCVRHKLSFVVVVYLRKILLSDK